MYVILQVQFLILFFVNYQLKPWSQHQLHPWQLEYNLHFHIYNTQKDVAKDIAKNEALRNQVKRQQVALNAQALGSLEDELANNQGNLTAEAQQFQLLQKVGAQLDANASFLHNWKIQSQTIPNFLKPMLGPLAPPGMPDFVQISFGLENTFTYGASISQPLYLGGAGIAGIQTAKAVKRASEYNLESKKQNIIHQVASAFYSTLLTSELIIVQEEALSQAKANLDVVVKKYNVGTASGFDKMRATVDVANLEPGVISARNNYQSALTYLRNVLGLPAQTDLEISGEFRFVEDDFGHMELEQLHNSASKNRPEILALKEQKQITLKGISLARSNFLPKLFLV